MGACNGDLAHPEFRARYAHLGEQEAPTKKDIRMTSASNRPSAAPGRLTGPRQPRDNHTADAHMFLAQQAADAQAAIHQTLTAMQATAREAANVRWWTQHYPWTAVGTAAVLGYVVTTAVLAPPAPPPADPTPARPAAARPTWTASLFALVQTLVMGILRDALHPQTPSAGQGPVDPSIS